MMKKIFLSTIVLFLMSLSVSAQNYKRDIVYLKNGSIIKGDIVEQVPNKTLTIKTIDGSSFVYSFEEILKITKEKQASYNTKKDKRNNKHHKKFSYLSFNVGIDNSVKVNLVEANFAGQMGFGGMVKLGMNVGVLDSNFDNSLIHLAGGPSFSYSAGNTVGTVCAMTGIGIYDYTDAYGVDKGHIVLYGIAYTHRFFTNKNINLLVGADFINGFVGANIGFAYNW